MSHAIELTRIQHVQEGQTEDFSHIYDIYFQPLYNHIFYKTLNQELSEDIVSETFLKAFDKIASFHTREQGSFRSWLYTIANNILLDTYKKKDTDWLDDSIEYEDRQENITSQNNNRYINEQIMQKLDILGPNKKDLIIMRVREGLSYEEIAEITGRSVVALRKEFSSTIALLREACGDLLMICILCLLYK